MRNIVLLLALSLVPAAACATSSARSTAVSSSGRKGGPASAAGSGERTAPGGRPATDEELARYAAREKQSAGLEKFEGGRLGETSTIIIILLLVILIVIIA